MKRIDSIGAKAIVQTAPCKAPVIFDESTPEKESVELAEARLEIERLQAQLNAERQKFEALEQKFETLEQKQKQEKDYLEAQLKAVHQKCEALQLPES